MENIIETLTGNPLYLIGGVVLLLIIIGFAIKKIFKLVMILVILALLYGGYLYMTDPSAFKKLNKDMKKKIEAGQDAIDDLDEATKDLRKEAIDKVIEDVDKKMKKRGKK